MLWRMGAQSMIHDEQICRMADPIENYFIRMYQKRVQREMKLVEKKHTL